jgi:hypothetical protein
MITLPDCGRADLLAGYQERTISKLRAIRQAACHPVDAGSPLNQSRIEATFRQFGLF